MVNRSQYVHTTTFNDSRLSLRPKLGNPTFHALLKRDYCGDGSINSLLARHLNNVLNGSGPSSEGYVAAILDYSEREDQEDVEPTS